MIEKKIKGFYNSVQLPDDISRSCEEKLHRFFTVVKIVVSVLAASAMLGTWLRILNASDDSCDGAYED